VMYFTRNIDWYSSLAPGAEQAPPGTQENVV
jgi:hypothetical protein